MDRVKLFFNRPENAGHTYVSLLAKRDGHRFFFFLKISIYIHFKKRKEKSPSLPLSPRVCRWPRRTMACAAPAWVQTRAACHPAVSPSCRGQGPGGSAVAVEPRVEGHGCTLQGPFANLERKVIGHWRWRERVSFPCHLLVFRRELDAGAHLPGAARGLGCRAFASRAPGSRGGKREHCPLQAFWEEPSFALR